MQVKRIDDLFRSRNFQYDRPSVNRQVIGSSPIAGHYVMSQDIPDTPNPRLGFGVLLFAGWAGGAGWWAWWFAGGLVAAGGVEGEFAE
jgi:hypothetical protein